MRTILSYLYSSYNQQHGTAVSIVSRAVVECRQRDLCRICVIDRLESRYSGEHCKSCPVVECTQRDLCRICVIDRLESTLRTRSSDQVNVCSNELTTCVS